MMRDANIEEKGIRAGGRNISNLRYADDAALCADNHEQLTALITDLNKAGGDTCLKLNVKKNKVVVF